MAALNLPRPVFTRPLATEAITNGGTLLVYIRRAPRWRIVLRNPSVNITAITMRKSATSATDFGPASATLGAISVGANNAIDIASDAGDGPIEVVELTFAVGGPGTVDLSASGDL